MSQERLLEQRVVVGDLVGRVGPQRLAPCQVGVDGAALDRPGAHQCDLDGQIVERPGARAQQHLHLRPRLDLEGADRVGILDLGVDLRVVERDAREVDRLAGVPGDLVDALLDRAHMPSPSRSILRKPGIGARVLVPLADLATLHGRGHERHELVEPTRGDDHPTRVLREMARQPGDLGGQERERAEASIVGPLGHAGQARHLGADGLRVVAVGGAGQTSRSAAGNPSTLPSSRIAPRER